MRKLAVILASVLIVAVSTLAFVHVMTCDRPHMPVPVPAPAPAPEVDEHGWPRDEAVAVRRAWKALNDRRAQRGLKPLLLDPGLCRAAKRLAVPLGKGTARPHDGFPERVRNEGWPEQNCGVRSGFGNVSEGNSEGATTPEFAVTMLDDSPNPREGHRRDFEDLRFTHVGIAFGKITRGAFATFGGYACVVEYGARCDANQNGATQCHCQ